jgi:uncharacterized membrane protein YeaQ/YmgE (transglycosylase-associated protein family)
VFAILVIAAIILAFLFAWSLVVAITHVIPWIIVGFISGALASRIVEGKGLGCLMDILVGMAGSLIGGLIVRLADPSLINAGGALGVLQDIIVSFLGAVILLAVVRLVTPRKRLGGRRHFALRR